MVENRADILCMDPATGISVCIIRPARSAVTAQVETDDPEVTGKGRNLPFPDQPRLGPAVNKNERSVRRSGMAVRPKGDAIGGGDYGVARAGCV